MSKTFKIALAVSVLCVLLLIASLVFGIINVVDYFQEQDAVYDNVLNYVDALPRQGEIAYYISDEIILPSGERIDVPYQYDVIYLSKDNIYVAYTTSDSKKQVLRTDYNFENEELIFETQTRNQINMSDEKTIIYYFGDAVYVHHLDTGKTEEYTNVGYNTVYNALVNTSRYTIKMYDSYTVCDNDGSMLFPLNSYIKEDKYFCEISEMDETSLSLNNAYIVGNDIYVDVLVYVDTFSSDNILLTYKFDPETAKVTYIGYCTTYYSYSYDVFVLN